MIIKIERMEKIELLKALKDGFLDTSKIPALQKVLDEERPDLKIKSLSDKELDELIEYLQTKFNKLKL